MTEPAEIRSYVNLEAECLRVLEDVRQAFCMMPCLHGAVRCNIRDVRAEVIAALDSFLPEVHAVLEKAYSRPPKEATGG